MSSAVGGMNPHLDRGDIVVLTDFINLMGDNPLVGWNDDRLGPRFPDMSQPFDNERRKMFETVALEKGIAVRRAVLVAVAGPNLETAAEYRYLRRIGADVVGMSTVPEAIVAAHCGMRSLALSVVTDLCPADNLEAANIREIIKTAEKAEPDAARSRRRVPQSAVGRHGTRWTRNVSEGSRRRKKSRKSRTAVLDLWNRDKTFEKSVALLDGKPRFVFYEGPPTANGLPGVHHVMARVCKDIVCRFKTMTGHQVIRKAGWDTHGLPVEIEVEKELGISHKEQIEAYGVANFNAKCRESVFKYEKEWDQVHAADGVLARPRAPVRHLHQRLHRDRLVDPQAFLGKRSSLRRAQDRAVLPEVRDVPLEPRGEPRLQGRR